MKAFDLQVTGSLVVTGSIKTTDGTFILSGSDSNASSSFSSRITTNESNMTLATASIAALTASISRLNTEISTDDTDMTLATASIAAITASVSRIDSEIDTNAANITLATASIAAITASVSTLKSNVGQELNTDSDVQFADITSTGTITAVEVHTTFVSSSIAVSSGSNNFGDTSGDHHSFTGSLSVSGSLSVTAGGALTTNGAFTSLGIDDNADATAITIASNERITIGGADGNQLTINDGGTTNSVIQFQQNDSAKAMIGWDNTSPGTLKLNATTSAFADNAHLVISSSGYVGIGTESPASQLHVENDQNAYTRVTIKNDNAGSSAQVQTNYVSDKGEFNVGIVGDGHSLDGAAIHWNTANSNMIFATNNTERMRIDNSGKVTIGATTILSEVVGYNPFKLGIEGTGFTGGLYAIEHQNDISGGVIAVGKSRGTSTGAVTILQDNDIAGRLVFVGADGVDFRTNLAEIRATVNGTPGANSIPSELDFMVNDGLQNDAVQKMKIDAKGVLSTASGSAVSYNAERTRNYQEGHTIVLDRAEVQTEDPTGNFDYHLMKQFIATKSGTFRMKWFAKNQSGAQYWGWLIARNYGFNTNQTPTGSDGSSGGQKMVLLDQGGSSLSNPGYFATGLDSGNSSSVHAYREFNVQVTDVVPGDTIGLWMKVTNGSGGVVEGTGQDLFCKDFQILSVSPTIETNAVLSGSISIPDLTNSRFYIGTGDGSSKFTLLEDKDTYAALITQQQGNGKCLFLNSSASDEASNQELFRCSTDGQADRFTVYNNGKVVVNASQVHAGSSDIRVKKNITEISGSLNKLKQMRGVTFNWKTQEETTGSYDFKWNNLDTRTQYGMIAQEIETQYPELITSGSDTIKSVYYEGFIGVLVQGIKDLTTKVETLEAQMAQVSGSN